MPTYKPDVILNESNAEKHEKGSQFKFLQKIKVSRFRKKIVFFEIVADPRSGKNWKPWFSVHKMAAVNLSDSETIQSKKWRIWATGKGFTDSLSREKEFRPEGGHQIRIYIDLIGPLWAILGLTRASLFQAFLRKIRQIGYESTRFRKLLDFMDINVGNLDHDIHLNGGKKNNVMKLGSALGEVLLEAEYLASISKCKLLMKNFKKYQAHSLRLQARKWMRISKIVSVIVFTQFVFFDVFVNHRRNTKKLFHSAIMKMKDR